MKLTGCLQFLPWIGASALLFGLAGCGSDSGSGSNDPEYSSALEASSGSTGSSSTSTGGSSGSTAPSSASTATSSAASETQSSEEQLNEAQKVVNGSCGPEAATINKGELATWKFYRSSGDLYEQILAPFV